MSSPPKQRLGVCYYPEHWPQERWAKDAELMVRAGISHVRIGEFAWSRLEPHYGQYEFDWLDDAFELLDSHGLKIVLGTPTATPPKWLVDRLPGMLGVDEKGNERRFGSRRHYCFSSQPYREHCKRIATQLAKRYGRHNALVAWQIDNEYGCHNTTLSYSQAAKHGFRDWLAQKYQSPDALNKAWGSVFWSKEYRSFDEVELPNLTVTEPNPSHVMDFRRYASAQVVSFNKLQTDIIRKYSDAPIGHNFMGAFTEFDHYDVSQDLDIATWDNYPLGMLDRDINDEEIKRRYLGIGDPDMQAFHHDLYRTCGQIRNGVDGGRWWVMEQQPGPVNWAPYNPAPDPGAVRFWAWEAFAAGAELVSYFRWRQPSFAQEQMHEALLLPNGEFNEAYHACEQISAELSQFETVANGTPGDVALVFDYESQWAWEIQPQGEDFSYFELVKRFYRALRKKGINVDIIPPRPEAIANHKLIVMPGIFALDDAFIDAVEQSGAIVLAGPRTGSKNKDFQIVEDLPPGPLRRLVDLKITRVESRPPFAPIVIDKERALEGWREFVQPGVDVSELMKSKDGHGALFEHGNTIYVAGRPNTELANHVVAHALDRAGIKSHKLHRDIRMRDNGNIRYIFNYGPEPVDCAQLVNGQKILMGQAVLEPKGVLVVALQN